MENIFETQNENTSQLNNAIQAIRAEIAKVIVGQQQVVDLIIAGLLCDGHILIEGVPGVAKTLTAKLVARIINVKFNRLQFTPDLMPSDVLGTSVFNPKEGTFNFRQGPIFSNIVLIDEINRAPAKTQSALFEVMEERQVTQDGVTHKMQDPFIVLATQNPIEQEGTYRLPEAQLDRFIFKIEMGYPTAAEEVRILAQQHTGTISQNMEQVQSIIGANDIAHYRYLVSQITVSNNLLEYVANIIAQTRSHASLYLGASTRASLALLKSAKAAAALKGRDFVIPEDVQEMALHVLRHRIVLTPEKEMEGLTANELIDSIIKSVDVPR
jgi:MoxR-like ATPase